MGMFVILLRKCNWKLKARKQVEIWRMARLV